MTNDVHFLHSAVVNFHKLLSIFWYRQIKIIYFKVILTFVEQRVSLIN